MAYESRWDRAGGQLIIHYYTPEGARQARKIGTYADRPGEYFDGGGNPVSDEVAKAAGIDIEADRARGKAIAELKQAEAKLEAQLAELRKKARVSRPVEDRPIKKIDMDLRESPNFRMSYSSSDKSWSVLQKDDDSVLASGISKEEAAQLLHDDIYGVTG